VSTSISFLYFIKFVFKLELTEFIKTSAIKLFEEKKVCTLWDSETEEWYFSVIDVVAVLTKQHVTIGKY